MKQKYDIHPDFRALSNIRPPLNRFTIPVFQRLLQQLYYGERSSEDVQVERISIPSAPNRTIRALLYSPKAAAEQLPCLVYFHGGGFVFPAAPYQYTLARQYAEQVRCRVLFVDYRLAPKHPFPAAPEDCFAAYCWALSQAERLRIDPAHIAVCGDSAGGTLALAACLMAMDHHQPVPCAQLLTYPAVGDCGETESIRQFTDTPMCNTKDMNQYGRMYVQDPQAGKLSYRSPIEADSLESMPPTYIETAEFDCLRDGGILMAKRLEEAGVPVSLHQTKGTVHGYDMALKSPMVQQCIRDRIAFLKQVFSA